ncbi:MAG: glycosyl hydrolase [Pseudomonas sp.]|nr:glycosyl hydrolase [Pseudomonas sp.]
MTNPGLYVFQLLARGTRLTSSTVIISLTLMSGVAHAATDVIVDTLREPAPTVDLRLPAPVLAVARAGDALVSVGLHGLIERSVDAGQTWQQMPSPVATDLVQVRFRDAFNGWAVGHDAVVLHSRDGGLTWKTQLDGRSLLTLLHGFYGPRADKGDESAAGMLKEVTLALSTSATADVLSAPFLDVLFDAKGQGFVVGAFGAILHSTDDGKTWEPWTERSDNDRRMHLYGLAEDAGVFYVSGEQGLLMRLDPQGQHFVQVTTPYAGTLFGVNAKTDLLLVYGLRGNLFASRDSGQTWQKVETGMDSSLVSTVDQGGTTILVAQGGQIAALDRSTLQVTALAAAPGGDIYAASDSGQAGQLIVTRFSGTKVVQIAKAN